MTEQHIASLVEDRWQINGIISQLLPEKKNLEKDLVLKKKVLSETKNLARYFYASSHQH